MKGICLAKCGSWAKNHDHLPRHRRFSELALISLPATQTIVAQAIAAGSKVEMNKAIRTLEQRIKL